MSISESCWIYKDSCPKYIPRVSYCNIVHRISTSSCGTRRLNPFSPSQSYVLAMKQGSYSKSISMSYTSLSAQLCLLRIYLHSLGLLGTISSSVAYHCRQGTPASSALYKHKLKLTSYIHQCKSILFIAGFCRNLRRTALPTTTPLNTCGQISAVRNLALIRCKYLRMKQNLLALDAILRGSGWSLRLIQVGIS